jgi:hypothetical protein|tara:strand:+ start:20112 stop:21263 length:1152 start_codon:yes stop_codon:yes gene_type:complete
MTTIIGSRGTGGPQGPARATSANVSQREDLANFITMITRDETPFISSIGKSKATAIYHEWQTDTLEAPGDSRIAEGQDWLVPGASDPTPSAGAKFQVAGPFRTRLGNYTQINGKTIAVSGTRRAVDQAGVADEYAYQLKKRGTELRRDIERDMVGSMNVSAAVGVQANAARSAGCVYSFINNTATTAYVGQFESPGSAATPVAMGDGTQVVHSTISGSTTAPTKGSLALTDVDSVMQKIYEQGGKATKVMLSPKLRRDFSDLMVSDTGVVRNIDESGKLRQSVDVYMSDFGDVMVVPNYVMGLSNNLYVKGHNGVAHSGGGTTNIADFTALIYDPMWFNMATLRPLQEVDVGQKGDSTVGMMVEEQTLEVRNPLGCGAIYGLN